VKFSTITVVKGSAGHILAAQLGFGEPPRWQTTKKRTGRRLTKPAWRGTKRHAAYLDRVAYGAAWRLSHLEEPSS
jgi:hypothetical protein